MAWTNPKTFTGGATLTAGELNTYLRDNMNETAPAAATTAGGLIGTDGANSILQVTPVGDEELAIEATTSAAYTDLTTPGPSVVVVTGTTALVGIGMRASNGTAGNGSDMSFAVTGATTRAARGEEAIRFDSTTGSSQVEAGTTALVTGLTPGTNTFICKYRVIIGGTATFSARRIWVLPLG